MITYITAFIFYTLAMVGILLIGFLVYKKTFVMTKTENRGGIKVLDSYIIAPKKTLMIVKVENEKFLIAADATSTSFLAKLSDDESDYGIKDVENMKKMNNAQLQEQVLQSVIQNNSYNQKMYDKRYDTNNDYQLSNDGELQRTQNQFMDLYKETETTNINSANKLSAKKEAIQKLLRELNENKTQIGGRY